MELADGHQRPRISLPLRIGEANGNQYIAGYDPPTDDDLSGQIGFDKPIDLKIADQKQLKLSFKAKTGPLSSPISHNSGMGIRFSESTYVAWLAEQDGTWQLQWRPNAAVRYVVTGIPQNQTDWVSFEIIVDLENSEIYALPL
ncbi:MAG: hypothetical protein R3C28_28410 [Pirellulaceae bacterium]